MAKSKKVVEEKSVDKEPVKVVDASEVVDNLPEADQLPVDDIGSELTDRLPEDGDLKGNDTVLESTDSDAGDDKEPDELVNPSASGEVSVEVLKDFSSPIYGNLSVGDKKLMAAGRAKFFEDNKLVKILD